VRAGVQQGSLIWCRTSGAGGKKEAPGFWIDQPEDARRWVQAVNDIYCARFFLPYLLFSPPSFLSWSWQVPFQSLFSS